MAGVNGEGPTPARRVSWRPGAEGAPAVRSEMWLKVEVCWSAGTIRRACGCVVSYLLFICYTASGHRYGGRLADRRPVESGGTYHLDGSGRVTLCYLQGMLICIDCLVRGFSGFPLDISSVWWEMVQSAVVEVGLDLDVA